MRFLLIAILALPLCGQTVTAPDSANRIFLPDVKSPQALSSSAYYAQLDIERMQTRVDQLKTRVDQLEILLGFGSSSGKTVTERVYDLEHPQMLVGHVAPNGANDVAVGFAGVSQSDINKLPPIKCDAPGVPSCAEYIGGFEIQNQNMQRQIAALEKEIAMLKKQIGSGVANPASQ